MNPFSSAMTGKMKSVGETVRGRKPSTFCVPFKNPLPQNPPEPTAMADCRAFQPEPSGSRAGSRKVAMRSHW